MVDPTFLLPLLASFCVSLVILSRRRRISTFTPSPFPTRRGEQTLPPSLRSGSGERGSCFALADAPTEACSSVLTGKLGYNMNMWYNMDRSQSDGMQAEKEFTLIELLVVSAIIAVLVMILFPVFV